MLIGKTLKSQYLQTEKAAGKAGHRDYAHTIGLRLPAKVTRQVDHWAEMNGVTRSEAIRSLISRRFRGNIVRAAKPQGEIEGSRVGQRAIGQAYRRICS